jgi:hypothetical protein
MVYIAFLLSLLIRESIHPPCGAIQPVCVRAYAGEAAAGSGCRSAQFFDSGVGSADASTQIVDRRQPNTSQEARSPRPPRPPTHKHQTKTVLQICRLESVSWWPPQKLEKPCVSHVTTHVCVCVSVVVVVARSVSRAPNALCRAPPPLVSFVTDIGHTCLKGVLLACRSSGSYGRFLEHRCGLPPAVLAELSNRLAGRRCRSSHLMAKSISRSMITANTRGPSCLFILE